MLFPDFTRLLTGKSIQTVEMWNFKRNGRVYTGVIIEAREYSGGSMPAGTYFRVSSDELNTRPWIYEADFCGMQTVKVAV
jgi:hypothetical protein